jgi:transaldolase/glucose-6-phosphate isomerase
VNIQSSLPDDLMRGLQAAQADWKANNKLARLWAKDATLWTNDDEGKWVGCRDLVERDLAALGTLRAGSQDL